jgi:hypothetical protein
MTDATCCAAIEVTARGSKGGSRGADASSIGAALSSVRNVTGRSRSARANEKTEKMLQSYFYKPIFISSNLSKILTSCLSSSHFPAFEALKPVTTALDCHDSKDDHAKRNSSRTENHEHTSPQGNNNKLQYCICT